MSDLKTEYLIYENKFLKLSRAFIARNTSLQRTNCWEYVLNYVGKNEIYRLRGMDGRLKRCASSLLRVFVSTLMEKEEAAEW